MYTILTRRFRPCFYICILMAGAVSAPRAQATTRTASAAPGAFRIRGIKGLWWDGIDKYRKALPFIADHGMNFLMFCYSAWPASSQDWRSTYTAAQLDDMRDLNTRARDLGVTVCLSFNPGLFSKPPLCMSCDDDYQKIWQKVRTVHATGITWFALCLDDINRAMRPEDQKAYGKLENAQSALVNRLWKDMETLSPRPVLIFCPSAYTTADMEAHQDYIKTLGEKIDPEVMMFWTGPTVCSRSITAADADKVAAWLRRKPFIWDNYPVNDMFPWRPLLAPLDHRDPNLAGSVSGILFNPMKQWYASKIPLVSLAEYVRDPRHYDPKKALDDMYREYSPKSRPILHRLIAVYGSSFLGDPGYPPTPHANSPEQAATRAADLRQLMTDLESNPELAGLWDDVRETMQKDYDALEAKAKGKPAPGPTKK